MESAYIMIKTEECQIKVEFHNTRVVDMHASQQWLLILIPYVGVGMGGRLWGLKPPGV